MPELPGEVPTATIESPDDRDYSFENAYVREIIAPVGPLYRVNMESFNKGSRQAWPLNRDKAFGKDEEDENILRHWRESNYSSSNSSLSTFAPFETLFTILIPPISFILST